MFIPLQGGGPGLQEPLQLGELDITSDEFILDEVDGKRWHWMQTVYNLSGMGTGNNKAGIGVQMFSVGRGHYGTEPL